MLHSVQPLAHCDAFVRPSSTAPWVVKRKGALVWQPMTPELWDVLKNFAATATYVFERDIYRMLYLDEVCMWVPPPRSGQGAEAPAGVALFPAPNIHMQVAAAAGSGSGSGSGSGGSTAGGSSTLFPLVEEDEFEMFLQNIMADQCSDADVHIDKMLIENDKEKSE